MWEIWEDEDSATASGSGNAANSSGACIKQEEPGGSCPSSGSQRLATSPTTGGTRLSGATLDARRDLLFSKLDIMFPVLDLNVYRVNIDALTLEQKRVAAGTWVDVQPQADKDKWHLRCGVCHREVAALSSNKGCMKYCKQTLRQHAQTKKHRHGVFRVLSMQVDAVGRPIADLACPTKDEFQKVWHDFTDGKLNTHDSCSNVKDMVSCLDAAVREIALHAMVSAESISLMRDERRQRLMLRFACCSPELVVASGVVGVAKEFGTGHVAISIATTDLVTRICNGDQAMATAVLNKVELLCVDAAADEVLSGERMRGRSGAPADVPVVTPNLKVIFRDGAHASRRFLSRLWKADESINDVIDGVVRNRHSITQRIHNSLVFTSWFQQEVLRDGGTIKNLRAAKHRFESYAKPLSRIVLNFPALIRTSERIACERHGQAEGQDATAFLQWVSPASVILLAMLADAAIEVLTFTRQCDREDVDSANIPSHLNNLLARIECLFVRGDCMVVGGCFAARLRECIRRTRIMYMVGGALRTLEEPSSVDVQCGLEVLTRWVGMVRDTAAAEFPNFTVLSAFQIFSLADTQSSHQRARENTLAVERLAQVFGVCPAELEQDLVRWRPVAEQVRKDTRCGNKEAWSRAVQPLLQSRARQPRSCDAPALITVLHRYVAWCVSTSGIESVFSASDRLMRTRGSATEQFEETMLRLVAARSKDVLDHQDVLQRARAIWSTRYTRRMHRKGPRVDKGTKRKHKATSETTVLAQRREAVAAQVAASVAAEAASAAAEPPESLPPGLQKELEFQLAKFQQRKVEAARDGALVPAEVDDALHEALSVELEGVQERAKKRAAAARRMARHMEGASCNWDALRGQSVWVDDQVQDAAVTAALELRGLSAVSEPNLADVFIVKDVSSLANPIRFWSGCKGLHVLASNRLVAGDHGAFLVLERALRLRRFLWATAAFQAKHANFWELILNVAASHGSKWKVFASEQEFVAKAQKEKSKMACIVLAKRVDPNAPAVGTTMTKHTFLEWLFVIKVGASNLGR